VPRLRADGWLLMASYGIRLFAYGFLAVVLALYLGELGLSPELIGIIFTVALAGGAIFTAVATVLAERVGRRRVLAGSALMMALGGAMFAVTSDPAVLTLAALVGAISPSGRDVGPFLSIEQAMLPETTERDQRTAAFALYNVVGSLASAVGALVAGAPDLLGLPPLTGYRFLLWVYAGAALLQLATFARLSSAVEHAELKRAAGWAGVDRSRGVVARFGALFALDSFASGLVVQSLAAYWFNQRWGLEAGSLGAIFFAANLISAVTALGTPALARRFGLLGATVVTHIPGNVLLILMPLMPSVELAVALPVRPARPAATPGTGDQPGVPR
jgi:MFS family permease